MKKVLMVARVFPPFHSKGHSIRVIKFIKYLHLFGWMPSVLTIDDQDEYLEDRREGSESALKDLDHSLPIYRTSAGEPSLERLEKEKAIGQRNGLTALIFGLLTKLRSWVYWHALFPDRYIVWLPFAVMRGRQIVRTNDIKVLFATCPPNSDALVGVFLKLLTGKPLVLDFRDDWIDTPWYASRSFITRFVNQRLERWVVKHADRVILVTEWSRRAFCGRYSLEPLDKFVLIPNGCDLAEFTLPPSAAPLIRDGNFRIVHAGSLSEGKAWNRNPAALFQAIRSLLQHQPEVRGKFSLLLTGRIPESFHVLIEENGLGNVVQEVGYLPEGQLLRLLKSADLLLAVNYEGFATLIPGKIYEYWAVGGPPILLLSCPGAASSFVEQHRLGSTVDASDVAGIEQAIMTVYRDSKTAAPLRVSTGGIEAYDRRALTEMLSRVLSTVA